MSKMHSRLMMAMALAAAVCLLASCGGGGITITPNPPGGNQTPTKSPPVNAGLIYAGPHQTIAAHTIQGQPGAAEPGATVHFFDGAGLHTEAPVGSNGSFEITTFPAGWDIVPGNTIQITQDVPGMTPSDARPVVISN